MHTVIHEERPDAHVEPPFVKKVHVADDRGPERRQTTGRNAVEHARDQDARPARAIRRHDIGDAGDHRRGEHEGPAAVRVRDGQHEQRAGRREHEEHGQLVRRRHGRDVEGISELHERRVDDCARERADEGEERDLYADGELERRRPVLEGLCELMNPRIRISNLM